MKVHLPKSVEQQSHDVAVNQGRAIGAFVAEVARQSEEAEEESR